MNNRDEPACLSQTPSVGVAVLDRNRRVLCLNDWLCAVQGKPIDVYVGQTLEEVFPELAHLFNPWIDQVIDTKKSVLDEQVVWPGIEPGDKNHWLVSFHAIKNGEETVQQISIVVQDITAFKREQEELRRTHEYLDSVLSNLPMGVAILEGQDFRYSRINQWLAEINGLPVEDHLDRPLEEVLPDAAQDILPGLRQVLETGEPLPEREFSTRLPKDPDVTRHFVDSFFAVKGADGSPGAVVAVVREITARKHAEEALQRSYSELEHRVEERSTELIQSNAALREEITYRRKLEESLRGSEERLAYIIDIAGDAIISTDTKQQITLFNKEAEKIFGHSANNVLGQPLSILLPPRLHTRHGKYVSDFVNETKSSRRMGERLRVLGRRNNGDEFPAEASISKVKTGNEHVITVVLRDISEREKADEELRQHRGELAHALRVSTIGELTATLAHEINQPLAAIRSNADAGKRIMSSDAPDLTEINEILKDIVDDIRRASEVIHHMRAMLNKHSADSKAVDINQIVNDVIKLVHSESVFRNVAIETELAAHLPLIMGDDVQLQQVCMNLMLNAFDAMKSIPESKRRVLVRTALMDETIVSVSIHDQGTGIDDQNAALLFTPFHTTKATGLGMGLAICRSIIDAHSGKIFRLDNPGGGSVFQFTLPVVLDGKS